MAPRSTARGVQQSAGTLWPNGRARVFHTEGGGSNPVFQPTILDKMIYKQVRLTKVLCLRITIRKKIGNRENLATTK